MTDDMKETIGIKLNEIASQFVAFSLAEAETESYPYAVYTTDIAPTYTKDGVHHYDATVTLTVYALDLDTADYLADGINAAIIEQMRGDAYSARLMSSRPDCVEGIWSRELSYTIRQFR